MRRPHRPFGGAWPGRVAGQTVTACTFFGGLLPDTVPSPPAAGHGSIVVILQGNHHATRPLAARHVCGVRSRLGEWRDESKAFLAAASGASPRTPPSACRCSARTPRLRPAGGSCPRSGPFPSSGSRTRHTFSGSHSSSSVTCLQTARRWSVPISDMFATASHCPAGDLAASSASSPDAGQDRDTPGFLQTRQNVPY